MKRSEFKNIIKEMIIELNEEKSINFGSTPNVKIDVDTINVGDVVTSSRGDKWKLTKISPDKLEFRGISISNKNHWYILGL